MKKIIFLSLFFFIAFGSANAQKTPVKSKPIISTSGVAMKKYHEQSELEGMAKGQLIELYIERNKVLINLLPYIALTSKPGITMQDVGIPNNPENNKIMDNQTLNTKTFLDGTISFQKTMLPYADKGTIITAILYYESMLRELNQANQ